MAIRKLLVPLSETSADDVAIAAAARVAKAWNAHVVALYFYRASISVQAAGSDIFPVGMVSAMVDDAETERTQQIQDAQDRFARIAADHGLATAAATRDAGRATAELVLTTGRPDEIVAHFARLADLTVVPHLDYDQDALFKDALHAALFDSGRPVLIAPRSQTEAIGKCIAIAWNGTSESASGVQAVMPWLKRAEAVRVLTATGYQRRGPEAQALGEYLALHGIRAELATFQPVDKSVGLGLLKAADGFGADLLAMGAYSHPRWRQTIWGGVTRSVLEHATIPVLMNR